MCCATKLTQTLFWSRSWINHLPTLSRERQEKTKKTSPTPSRHSRECTVPVRRWHGELRVLIKIFFYKSACAVQMRDNRLEKGGVWRILKQLPALKQTPELTWRSTPWRNACHFTFTFPVWSVKSIGLFSPHREPTVCKASHIEQYIDILDMKWANRKQFNIVVERQYRELGGSAPCMEIW